VAVSAEHLVARMISVFVGHRIRSLARSLTHSFTHSFTHARTHFLTIIGARLAVMSRLQIHLGPCHTWKGAWTGAWSDAGHVVVMFSDEYGIVRQMTLIFDGIFDIFAYRVTSD
jgi:hypothetical protein